MKTDAAKTAYQPNSDVLPLIEMARSENQRLHIELGNFAGEKELGVAGLRYDRDRLRVIKKHQPRIKVNGMP